MHFMLNNFFFRKSCWYVRYVKKCGRIERVTDDNMAHALYMLDN